MNYLKEYMKWCVWRYEDVGRNKPTKIPYNPITNKRVSVNKESDFILYEDIKSYTSLYAGLGIKVSVPLVAIDIDNCIENGLISNFAKDVISNFPNTYIEYSPSGSGFRIFCILSEDFIYDTSLYKMKSGSLEIYVGGYTNRFVTVTGNVYQDKEICEESIGLKTTLNKYLKREVTKPVTTNNKSYLTDEAVIEKASKAKNGEKFKSFDYTDLFFYKIIPK